MAEIDKGLESAISQKWSALIYCPIDPKEHVFPMIPGGNRLDQMIFW
jgi:thiamine pyrophosphate-dependent acetolactate synthase large subunit-like protein